MVKAPEKVTIKKEQKSDLWKIPAFSAPQRESPHLKTHKQSISKHQKPSPGPKKPSSSHRQGPIPIPVVEPAYLTATWTALSQAPKTPATTSAMPSERHKYGRNPDLAGLPASQLYRVQSSASRIGDSYRPSTNGLLNLDSNGGYLCPTRDNAETRMHCLYPGFRRLMKGADNAQSRQNGRGARVTGNYQPQTRGVHIMRVWSIVSSVMDELRDKSYKTPTLKLDVDRDSELGRRVVYLMMMQEANHELARSVSANGGHEQGIASRDSKNRDVGFPSHEEMLAYKVLHVAFEFPRWMSNTVLGTKFEYLLYPMPPNTPSVPSSGAALEFEQNLAEIAAKKQQGDAEIKCQQDELEARKRQADADFKRQKDEFAAKKKRADDDAKREKDALAAKTEQADANLKRKKEDLAAKKKRAKVKAKQQRAEIDRHAQERLEKINARSAHVDRMLPLLNMSVEELEAMHTKRISSSQHLLRQIKKWQKEGQRMDEEDEGGEELASSTIDEEEEQRPAKKRRRSGGKSDA
ncbi:hypothetical protein F503_01321 [Ophiostoma piceae UAMH 11346]|uniref:Uncharacterized protein n=1 Tax=Ophiostoma piceae (strain UAMH 11346) TaxID=1262450 RepID=S3BUZ8_OPHP1|nr:hypothetical protein F503_01321 [Ophiostoma piceae UAMH 11346]